MKKAFESSAPWPELRPLGATSLAALPFQLLPNQTRAAEEWDRLIKWQSNFAAFATLPTLQVIAIVSSQLSYNLTLESFAAQSYRPTDLIILKPPSLTLLYRDDLPHTVFEQPEGEPTGRALRAILIAASKQSAFGTPEESAIMVIADAILHPSALLIAAKEVATSSFIYCNALRCNHPRTAPEIKTEFYIRRAAPDRLSVLGRNPFGRIYTLRYELIKSLAADELLDECEVEGMFWRIGACASLLTPKSTRIPLGLGIELGSLPADPSITAIVHASAQDRGVTLVTMKPVELLAERGIIPEPVDIPGEIQVVIPYRNQSALTIKAIQSLASQTVAGDLIVTLVNNSSSHEEQEKIESALAALPNLKHNIVEDRDYFNFARLNNKGASSAKTPYILFLNNDVELVGRDTVKQLRSWLSHKEVGCVGGLLRYDNGKTQHAGINFLKVRPGNMSLPEHYANSFREVDGVTFAMAMVKRSAYEGAGRLDESLCPNGFGDALFCLNLRKVGFRSLFTPLAEGIHHESISRGRTPEELELWEMHKSGLEIAELYDDFSADNQPAVVPVGAAGDRFNELVEKIRFSPTKLRTANTLSSIVLTGWAKIKKTRRAPRL